jgi:poly(hydroxyalkanoate) depolymerase family esterase
MNELAEKGMFFVAYPEQAESANGSRCWNWFLPTNQVRGGGEPSILAGITQQIMRTYRVDSSQVYVAGISAGGAMAAILAATYPDLYAAVGVHSGLAYGSAQDLRSAFAVMSQGKAQHTQPLMRAIPLIVFHGDRDTTVNPANAEQLLKQWLAAPSAASGRRSTREVTVVRGQVSGGRAYTRFLYREAPDRTFAEKWVIHQAGHAWSGGSPSGSFTDPRGPNASAEMLRFFREHARRS